MKLAPNAESSDCHAFAGHREVWKTRDASQKYDSSARNEQPSNCMRQYSDAHSLHGLHLAASLIWGTHINLSPPDRRIDS